MKTIEGSTVAIKIFNVDKITFQKRMPSYFLGKRRKPQPRYKVVEDHLTFVLGRNADGNYKLKPLLLVYFSQILQALKGQYENNLPVRHQIKHMNDKRLVHNSFAQLSKVIAGKKKYLVFKASLVLDHSP